MSTQTKIFLLRVKMTYRHNREAAMQMLRRVGRSFDQAVSLIARLITGSMVLA